MKNENNNLPENEALEIAGVSGSLLSDLEKAKIDYEIQAKKKMRDQELGEWASAGCLVFICVGIVMVLISAAV